MFRRRGIFVLFALFITSASSLQKNLKIEVFHSLEGHYFWCVRSFEALLVV